MFPLLEQTVANALSLPSGFRSKVVLDESTSRFRTVIVLDELNNLIWVYQAFIGPDDCEQVNAVWLDTSVLDEMKSNISVQSA